MTIINVNKTRIIQKVQGLALGLAFEDMGDGDGVGVGLGVGVGVEVG